MQNSPGPNNFSLDKLQNIVLTKCGSFFKKLQGQWTLSLHVYKNTYLFHIIFASMHRLVWYHRLRHEALSTCNVTQRITTGHPSLCLLVMRFYFWLISFKPKFKRQIVFVEIYLKKKMATPDGTEQREVATLRIFPGKSDTNSKYAQGYK